MKQNDWFGIVAAVFVANILVALVLLRLFVMVIEGADQ